MMETAQPSRGDGEPGAPGLRAVGPFRLLERIGSGGMGVVYLAERREPVAQRVALKVIRTDRLDRTYQARFAMEQQALARMDHPNVARLLDAGEADGQSWFAMEYVPGQPLDDYCREHTLSIEQRLRLFVQVCDGVQHAHMKGILHRDLKPGNILVREVDGRPVAKIIDFGLAQPVDPLQIRATLHEAVQQVVGTLAYMSPEQATRTEGDLDTRTDVYSLGAVLYELLTGEPPLDLADAERRGLAWFGAFLREYEPPRPSTRLSALGERLPAAAAERATSPQRLQSALRGDLDWVTMKALARDRQQRYPTVRDLGREIERVLAHRPVEAGPPNAWYVACKWLRRHRVGVSVAGVVLAVGAAAGLVAARYAAQARLAENRRDLFARGLLAAEHVRRAEAELWPADEALVPAMTAWLDELPRLLAIDADLAACAQELADAAAAPSALHEQHLAMVRRGREAIARLRELRPFVVGRLERARTLRARTVTACQDRWRAAREQLRDDPRFRGFDLPDLPGLVPLGRNEASGLQEFYSPDTGALEVHGLPLPERDARGRCRLGPHTGMVFVLVPGGDFEVEPGATRSLAPYLISRWEVTRAQWARLRADGRTDARELAWHDPSNDFPFVQREAGVEGSPATPPGHDLDWNDPLWLHPVQQVSYHDAVEVLGRWPLQLPTVAQWLWAANGGTGGAARLDFAWLGDEVGRYVNWRDEVFRRTDLVGRLVAPGSPGAAWDGFVFTCPVDRLEPNPFGLHSMVGNVAELCLDAFASPPPARAEGGNQLTVSAAAPTQRAVAMGFQFSRTVDFTQPDWRRALVTGQQVAVVNREATVGLRPVWRLDRR